MQYQQSLYKIEIMIESCLQHKSEILPVLFCSVDNSFQDFSAGSRKVQFLLLELHLFTKLFSVDCWMISSLSSNWDIRVIKVGKTEQARKIETLLLLWRVEQARVPSLNGIGISDSTSDLISANSNPSFKLDMSAGEEVVRCVPASTKPNKKIIS